MRYLFTLSWILFGSMGFAQENFFQEKKTGTFQKVNAESDLLIKRTSKRQIEFSAKENWRLVFKVKWIDERNYQLIFVKAKNLKTPCLFKGYVINVKITEATRNSYKWESFGGRIGKCGGERSGEYVQIE